MLVVLASGRQFGPVGVGQWIEFAVTPTVLIGDKDDPAGVADQEDIAALAPFALQLRELQLDHHGAEKATVLILHRAGEEVAGHAAGHADGIEASAALAAGLFEIRAETIVGADIGAGQAPVAGRYGKSGMVQQFQSRRVGRAVDAFEFAV
ncbi:hypothetical protein D3C79_647890 [compost metagenome]